MGDSSTAARPFEGVRVLDLTQALAGPHATFLLAGLGADVIKVENPRGGDMARSNPPFFGPEGPTLTQDSDAHISMSYVNRARGKRGITLNLKSEAGRELFFGLVRDADVVVENFSAGTSDRLGIGYTALRSINERIIFCALSGFGADQPAGVKAMDTVVQALSGAAVAGGLPDMPPMRVGFPLGDTVAPLFAVMGIAAALYRREHTGVGDFVDVSMLGALTSLVATEDWAIWDELGVETRNGPRLPRLAPFGMYACRDGHVAITAGKDSFAHAVFRVMGRDDLVGDPKYSTIAARMTRDEEITALIEAWAADHDAQEVADLLTGAGVPAAPVRKPIDAVRDPRLLARGETLTVLHPNSGEQPGYISSGVPIVFSESTTGFDRPAPALGEHNEEVYAELGLTSEDLTELRAAGTI